MRRCKAALSSAIFLAMLASLVGVAAPQAIAEPDTPTVTATPASGVVDTGVTVRGTSFTANASAAGCTVWFAGIQLPAGALLWRSHTNTGGDGVSATGVFEVELPIPAVRGAIGGIKTIRISDGVVAGEVNFTVGTPAISFVPATSKPNTPITVNGSGFPASGGGTANDMVYWTQTPADSPPGDNAVTNIATDAQGAFTQAIRVPWTYLDGQAWIHVQISTRNAIYGMVPGFTTVVAVKTAFTVEMRDLTFDPASGPKGTEVVVNSTDLSPGGNIAVGAMTIGGIQWNTAQWVVRSTTARMDIDTSGKIVPKSFEVPTVAGLGYGDNLVQARDSGNLLAQGTFKVTRPTIELTPNSGYMGTPVIVKGTGWVPGGDGAVTVRLDNGGMITTIAVGIPDGNGAFKAAFDIPLTVGVGLNSVAVTAQDNLLNNAQPQLFEILEPSVSVSPNSGAAGDAVSISGFGFQPQTAMDRLMFGTVTVLPRCGSVVADKEGAFEVTCTVPALARGPQQVFAEDAFGDVASTFFRLDPGPPKPPPPSGAPAVSVQPASGPSGTEVTVAGAGFSPLQGMDRLRLGAVGVLPWATPFPLVTDAYGGFEATFTVPPLAMGSHEIEAMDASGYSAAVLFLVDPGQPQPPRSPDPPTLSVQPGSGPAGTEITIAGAGFSPLQGMYRVTIGGATVVPCSGPLVTDALGGFEFATTVPGLPAGSQVVEAVDAMAQVLQCLINSNVILKTLRSLALQITLVYSSSGKGVMRQFSPMEG